MIEVENLTKDFGPRRSLHGISFRVPEGAVLGFLGPNGAGKTTTMRILTGLSRATAGTARLGGHDIEREHAAVRRILGYLPEEAPLYPEMTVESYLGFMAGMKALAPASVAGEVSRVVAETNLVAERRRVIGNLSKGTRQRVGLAQALLGDPRILVLDEPTVGLDPGQISEIRRLIAAMKGRRTVILSTHILPEVAMTCTHVVILNRGRIVAQGTVEEVGRSHGTRELRVTIRGEAAPAVAIMAKECGVEPSVVQVGGTHAVPQLNLGLAPDAPDRRAGLARALVEGGVELLELFETAPTLEDVFLRSTSGAPAGEEAS